MNSKLWQDKKRSDSSLLYTFSDAVILRFFATLLWTWVKENLSGRALAIVFARVNGFE